MTAPAERPTGFRPEIAGLRAVAVLAVILFHAGITQLEGGYVGVDVFFVLSGFLIINIIRRDLGRDTFSFWDFYARRAKRLFPAAFALVLATVAAGFFFLGPEAYAKLSESAVASLGFVANIYFYFNTGYFDAATETLPLIHMWSLGIEEQFYLFSPVLIWAAFRLGRDRAVLPLLIGIGVVSFAFTLFTVQADAKFAFFQLPSRAWQFAVGGLLTFLPALRSRALGNGLSLAGLAAVLWGIFTLSGDQPYPSWNALYPTLGSAALIYATTTPGNLVRAALSVSPMVWVGKVSYSAYLWHWPVIVYYRLYILERHFTYAEAAVLTVVSLVLGWLSWRFIEERFRHIQMPAPRAVWGGLAGAGALALVPFFVIVQQGLPGRVEGDVSQLTDVGAMWKFDGCVDTILVPTGGPSCVVGVPWAEASAKAVLWGDSHSEHFAPAFAELAQRRDMAMVIGPRSCPPFLHRSVVLQHGASRARSNDICTRKQDAMVDWLQTNPDVEHVILTAAWSGYDIFKTLGAAGSTEPDPDAVRVVQSGMDHLFERLRPLNRTVTVLGDVPRPNIVLNSCLASEAGGLLRQSRCPFEMDYLSASNVRYYQSAMNAGLAEAAAREPGVRYHGLIERMCGDAQCSTFANGEFIYRDSNHLRRNIQPKTARELADRMELSAVIEPRRPAP